MTAYFIDIDCLLTLGGMAWIVDKTRPNVPIMKVSRHEFNLYKSGVYRSQNNKVEFNGVTFWLPSDVYGLLKVRLKDSPARLGNLAISMQEFMNRELVENMPFEVNSETVSMLKNKTDDIYIICPRQVHRSYRAHLDRLIGELSNSGVKVKNQYHLSESFHNQSDDLLSFRKARLLLQHAVGYKTDDRRFVDTEVAQYSKILVYDSNRSVLGLKTEVNDVLRMLLKGTEDGLSRVIIEDIQDNRPGIELNYMTGNEVNRLVSDRFVVDNATVVRHFESFVTTHAGLFLR